jgi:hypothetical protein
MATARAQKEQWPAMARAQENKQHKLFFTLLFCFWQCVSGEESEKKFNRKNSIPLFFVFPSLFFLLF